jgi:hypothetical protein
LLTQVGELHTDKGKISWHVKYIVSFLLTAILSVQLSELSVALGHFWHVAYCDTVCLSQRLCNGVAR